MVMSPSSVTSTFRFAATQARSIATVTANIVGFLKAPLHDHDPPSDLAAPGSCVRSRLTAEAEAADTADGIVESVPLDTSQGSILRRGSFRVLLPQQSGPRAVLSSLARRDGFWGSCGFVPIRVCPFCCGSFLWSLLPMPVPLTPLEFDNLLELRLHGQIPRLSLLSPARAYSLSYVVNSSRLSSRSDSGPHRPDELDDDKDDKKELSVPPTSSPLSPSWPP